VDSHRADYLPGAPFADPLAENNAATLESHCEEHGNPPHGQSAAPSGGSCARDLHTELGSHPPGMTRGLGDSISLHPRAFGASLRASATSQVRMCWRPRAFSIDKLKCVASGWKARFLVCYAKGLASSAHDPPARVKGGVGLCL